MTLISWEFFRLLVEYHVPQIEVSFDIDADIDADADGILNVSAKDKGTGKE